MEYKKFIPLNVSSKFAICGLPLRFDTYKGGCGFGCTYCFANCRKIMEFQKVLQVGDDKWLGRKLKKVLIDNNARENDYLETLIKDGITWHCGGMSDPFQPCEQTIGATKALIDIANEYQRTILFSTKSDTVFDVNIKPELHSFQMSVTNIENNKELEPGVPDIERRYRFFCDLKSRGFKVGVRVQPFVPGVSNVNIVHMFKDADYFTLEGLKIVPQNKEHKEFILSYTGLKPEDFTQMGLLNLKPELREMMYAEFIELLEYYAIPYSIADNDMHHISSGQCCCGDPLVKKSTSYSNTAMCKKYGTEYTLDMIKEELGCHAECVCNQLFTSNRQEGCKTVADFYEKRFDRKSSPFSPKFLRN